MKTATALRRACTLAVAVLACAPPVGAADALKPLRHLVYDVTYDARAKRETKTSGMSNGDPAMGLSGPVSGTGSFAREMNGNDRGQLTVDVVAATPDGALVVDAAFTGQNSQPAVRVVVFADGRLSWNPAQPLSPAALRVLPLLARGFVSDKDVSPGSSWTLPTTAGANGALTYRVQHVDGDRATISIEGARASSGGDEHDVARTVYATDLLVPIRYELDAHIHRQLGVDDSLATAAHLTATLVSDTFAKK